MLFEPGPIAPIDEAAFRRLVEPGEPAAMAEALAPLLGELDGHAAGLDDAHDTFAAAGEPPEDDTDDPELVTVLVESRDLQANAELAPNAGIVDSLDASEIDISTLTQALSGEAALNGPPAKPAEFLTEEEIEAYERAHPYVAPL